MFLSFLKTKIGVSVVIALIIIASAIIFKIQEKNVAEKSALGAKVGLVADLSVKKALENGEIDNKQWENTLRAIVGTSTIDEKIAVLGQNNASSTISQKPLTATDRLAQAFFTKYIELKKSGAPIDETTGVNLVNELLTKDYGGPAGEKLYSASDITTFDSNTVISLKKYGNNLGAIFNQPAPADYENELVLVNQATETGINTGLKKLAQNIDRYETIRRELLETAAPKSLKIAHLALINSLSYIIEGVKGMALIDTDPAGATKMILKYEDGIKALDLSTHEMVAYFKKQKVTFSSTEAGYIFVE